MEMRIMAPHGKRVAGMAAAGMLALTLVGFGGGHASAAQNPPTETIVLTCSTTQDVQGTTNAQSTGGGATQSSPPSNTQQPGAQASTGPANAVTCTTDGESSSFAIAVDLNNCVVISITGLPDSSGQATSQTVEGSTQTAPEQGGTQQDQPQEQGVPSQGTTEQGGPTQSEPNQAQASSANTEQGIACAFAGNVNDQTQTMPAQGTANGGAVCTIVLADGAAAPQVGEIVTGQVVACDASGVSESGASSSTNAQPGTSAAPAQPTNTAPQG